MKFTLTVSQLEKMIAEAKSDANQEDMFRFEVSNGRLKITQFNWRCERTKVLIDKHLLNNWKGDMYLKTKILSFKATIHIDNLVNLEDILNDFAEKLGTDNWEVYIEKANEEEINEFN